MTYLEPCFSALYILNFSSKIVLMNKFLILKYQKFLILVSQPFMEFLIPKVLDEFIAETTLQLE